ncbi:hypothetical protein EDB19DRAFT_1629936, partial [Suillus lakei]
FVPHLHKSIILSDIGIVFSLSNAISFIYTYGFWTMFCLYLVPYLWVNHWLVLIMFLQHTDPLLSPLSMCSQASCEPVFCFNLCTYSQSYTACSTNHCPSTHLNVLHHAPSSVIQHTLLSHFSLLFCHSL